MIVTMLDLTADMQIYSETEDSWQVRPSGPPAEPGLLTGDDPPSNLRYPCST